MYFMLLHVKFKVGSSISVLGKRGILELKTEEFSNKHKVHQLFEHRRFTNVYARWQLFGPHDILAVNINQHHQLPSPNSQKRGFISSRAANYLVWQVHNWNFVCARRIRLTF
jgi:hypothetical protein